MRIIEADHHPASPDAVIETMVKARIHDEEPRIRLAEAVTPVESVEVVVVMPEPVVVMRIETVVMMSEAHVAAAVVEAAEVTAAAPAGQHHGIAGVVAGPG
ncbi:hypothetical protein [Pseudomonas sp. BN411]|uniref:hypothetical protein n=1 Tax=Pseudomonas sp. BN411 TaxID=2567887 RepID=UPI0024578398|nr:hypothetical protein [Pseudomonas sp. BN411]MDH4564614.1 hypothetical protein [Pseudomonas sp. BN411]